MSSGAAAIKRTRFVRWLRVVARKLGTAWCVLGVCLVAVVAFELVLRLIWLSKDACFGPPPAKGTVVTRDVDESEQPAWMKEAAPELNAQRMVWHPYVQFRREPFRGKYVNINDAGLRRTWMNPAIADVPSTQRFRIFMFGGSTIWGEGVRDDGTVPSHLAKLLSTEDLPIEVINFGETGYVNTQELLTLILRLRQNNTPNMVIFYDGINDCIASMQNRVPGNLHNEANRRGEFNLLSNRRLLRKAYVKSELRRFEGYDRLAQAVVEQLGLQAAYPGADDHDSPDLAALARGTIDVYEENIKLADILADHYGFTCQFFWQPLVYTKQYLTKFEARCNDDPRRNFTLDVYEHVRSSESLAQNPRFHDISSVFDGVKDEMYLDFAHLREEGNAIVAREMLRHVAPVIRERISQRSGAPK
jgi:lysophospholipase L1-like esterase